YVTDGRSATRRAAESGCSDTVLIDLALDFGTATRIAIAAAVDVAMCLGVNYPRGPLACRPARRPRRAGQPRRRLWRGSLPDLSPLPPDGFRQKEIP
ncbi:MAG: hypothetical protein WAS49_11570, partial [Candidatus Dechloromonas phosphoritropha]